MNSYKSFAIYTQDAELLRRVMAFTRRMAKPRHIEDARRFEIVLQQTGASLVLIDLRAPGALDYVEQIMRGKTQHLVLPIGIPRSDPMLKCEALEVHATIDLDAERTEFQPLIKRALEHLRLIQENEVLKVHGPTTAKTPPAPRPPRQIASIPLERFSKTIQGIQNLEHLLDNIVEGLTSSLKVSRVGVFLKIHENETFKLHAGYKTLRETSELEFSDYDAFVQWLEVNAHMVSKTTIDHVAGYDDKVMLEQAIDSFGAEVIIPLHARGRMIGWLFIGHRVTGMPFDYPDLEDLTIVADHTSTTIENALLYEEVEMQKTFAETLFHSLPTAIIAINTNGEIQWFNTSAESILEKKRADVIGQKSSCLGSKISDLLLRTLKEGPSESSAEWIDQDTQRSLVAATHVLADNGKPTGAIVLVSDTTLERKLREKQEQLERSMFWTDLAASMSHEIRNPLVAIKTFSQLLPERYEDPEFRTEFSTLVTEEVDRLNRIIDQINDFAHPPELQFRAVNFRKTVLKGVEMAVNRVQKTAIQIQTKIDQNLPSITGDETALAECFAEVLTNAMEACDKAKSPKITLRAQKVYDEQNGSKSNGDALSVHGKEMTRFTLRNGNSGILISVEDNGGGIPDELQEKIFSPFCTTKARGMGLGLPIVQRTIIDHSGELRIASSNRGTNVTICLPDQPGYGDT